MGGRWDGGTAGRARQHRNGPMGRPGEPGRDAPGERGGAPPREPGRHARGFRRLCVAPPASPPRDSRRRQRHSSSAFWTSCKGTRLPRRSGKARSCGDGSRITVPAGSTTRSVKASGSGVARVTGATIAAWRSSAAISRGRSRQAATGRSRSRHGDPGCSNSWSGTERVLRPTLPAAAVWSRRGCARHWTSW